LRAIVRARRREAGRQLPIASDLRNLRFSSGGEVLNPINRTPAVTAETARRQAANAKPSPDEGDFAIRLALPVASTRLPYPPSREAGEAAERANAGVLGFLLHEVDVEAMPRPSDERLAAALAPLRSKLDLLTELVSRFAYRDLALPPVTQLDLAPTHIAWHSREAWRRGEWVRLDLYFHQVYREPVSLFAAVTSCPEQDGESVCRRVTAELCEMLDSTRERLARLAILAQRQQQVRQRPRATAADQ
jgi:hypothetical protein